MKKAKQNIRLDRLLVHASGLGRSQVQRLIRAGEVSVDGALERDPARHVDVGQQVLWRGEPVTARGPRYFMLHKPLGYVSATRDNSRPTVLDLLREPAVAELHIAGRLDIDTTGLVLITDDGDWSHRVTAPRRKCDKVYRVELAQELEPGAEEALKQGVILEGEHKPTLPAQVQRLGDRRILLTISEGRYHQVKRMLAAVGNHVVALHRERIGDIVLDPRLAPGEYRALTDEEIASV